jgi:hypothetical protein
MKLQVIYTYHNGHQEFCKYPFVMPLLNSEELFIEYLLSPLCYDDKLSLLKVSTSIIGIYEKDIVPDWYIKRNGKFYFTLGQLNP